MQKKLLALLFVTTVLASSFAVSVLPTVNALTQRTDFSNRHLSASYGNSPICGDHICAPGEKTQWLNKMAELQRVGPGKIGNGVTYEEVLKPIQSNSTSTSGHTVTQSEHLQIAGNATKSENTTGTK